MGSLSRPGRCPNTAFSSKSPPQLSNRVLHGGLSKPCKLLRHRLLVRQSVSAAPPAAPEPVSAHPTSPQTIATPPAGPACALTGEILEGKSNPEPVMGPRGSHWEVHKFGGTCVSASDRIRTAAAYIMECEYLNTVAVSSAMGAHPSSPVKVTDLLLNMIAKAAAKDESYEEELDALMEKHTVTAKELLGDEGPAVDTFIATLTADMANLKSMLRAMCIAGLATEAFSDYVVGHGELWCSQLLCAYCRTQGADAQFMDARDVLVVKPTADGQNVDVLYDESNANLDAWFEKRGCPSIIITTGFIAKNPEGEVTTLKRNGSDYSATIMGALFRAGNISIWTDVDGVYSADPRKVVDAVCLPCLSYHEAWELSYFGANVLHPRTTLPAMRYDIPVVLRNFFNLEAPGTIISDACVGMESSLHMTDAVKGFATVEDVSLINVEGTGMVGVPGVAAAIFTTIRDAHVNVVMISQASSEHSVCFAVAARDTAVARQVLSDRFADAIKAGRLKHVEVVEHQCVLAAVGEHMAANKGTAATMFAALAKANVNIRAIAQGMSEYNITVVIDQEDATRALKAVHGRFYLSEVPIAVAVVGCGLIGAELLSQFYTEAATLFSKFNIGIKVMAVAGKERMLLDEAGVCSHTWARDMEARGQDTDLSAIAGVLHASTYGNAVIIDCSASDAVADEYQGWMEQGIHVITPNKKLGAGDLTRYINLRELQRTSYTHWFYEATVGAGLPILATLKHLVETGDRIISIEGVLSGSISYVFNTFGDGTPFSEVVASAQEQGFTEPDPRDDLSGMDVGRKVVILAREAGLLLSCEDVEVTSLVPEALRDVDSPEAFMAGLPDFDGDMQAAAEEAAARGEALRFVGVVDAVNKKGSVGVKSYPLSHPFCQLQGSDNIISFRTERYDQQPLTVRGPGAGAAVTAAGVFSDLLRLAAYLGAPS